MDGLDSRKIEDGIRDANVLLAALGLEMKLLVLKDYPDIVDIVELKPPRRSCWISKDGDFFSSTTFLFSIEDNGILAFLFSIRAFSTFKKSDVLKNYIVISNPYFGCKSWEEAMVRKDLLG